MPGAPWIFPVIVAIPVVAAILLSRRSRSRTLPLADASSLGRPARRTSLLRVSLALLLISLVAIAAALLRQPAQQPLGQLLSEESSTVIVLDLSTSVSDLVYGQIAGTLEEIVAQDAGRIGLVLFSDAAEEALPPGTRVAELRPFVRYFLPKEDPAAREKPLLYRVTTSGGISPTRYPLSPWFRKFSGGTRISAGLALAREALSRDGARDGRVLLISDLSEEETDLPALTSELVAYSRDAIELGIVALPPAVNEDLFRRVGGERLTLVDSETLTTEVGETASPTGSVSYWLVFLVGLIAVVLAARELLVVPLSWRNPASRVTP